MPLPRASSVIERVRVVCAAVLALQVAACASPQPRDGESKAASTTPKSAAQARAERRAWIARVEQHIDQHWAVPPAASNGAIDGFYCKARLVLSPDAGVVDVTIERSCGSAPLDASLQAAIRAASPLPVPNDPALLESPLPLLFSKVAAQGPGRRTLEDVRNGFRARGSDFQALFERASRGESGRVLVQLTIAPEGHVTACEIVTTDFSSAEYNAGVLQLVSSVKFAAREVAPLTVPNYPIDFAWR